jgi:hypothetical protein
MALIEAALDYIAESAVAPRGFFAMLIDPATLKCFAPNISGQRPGEHGNSRHCIANNQMSLCSKTRMAVERRHLLGWIDVVVTEEFFGTARRRPGVLGRAKSCRGN